MPDIILPAYTPGAAPGNPITYQDQRSVGYHQPFQLFDYQNASAGPGLYSDNPWYRMETLTQPQIQLTLMRQWKMNSLWRQFAPFVVSIQRTKSIEFSEIFDMEPNTDPIGLRQIWLPSQYTDTKKREIFFNKYGDKVALHEYDDMVTSYRMDNAAGLKAIAQTLLGDTIVDFLDIKIRNAYLKGGRFMMPTDIAEADWRTAGGYPDFSQLDETDAAHAYDPEIAMHIWLRMAVEGIPLAQNPNGTNGTMIAVTSPLPIHQIQLNTSNQFREPYLYANPMMLLRYEAGAFKNIRYLSSPRNIIWNAGNIKTQMPTSQDYGPGDGAYEGLVDGYRVGQPASTGIENWIELSAGVGGIGGVDADNIQIGDYVTIHTRRTSDFGVVDGVDYREGMARLRRVVAIDAGGSRIAFDKPLFNEFPVGSTWVTKATHVHATVVIGGPNGVVSGVGEPITAFGINPVDDLQEIWRFAWKGYFEMEPFKHEVYTVLFSAGVVPRVW